MAEKISQEEFIKRCKKVHGDRYDYSLVEYKTYHSKVKIICTIHGVFEQSPAKHLYGRGCRYCNLKCISKEDIIKRIKKYHNDKYEYNLDGFKDNKSKIKLYCKTHGEFLKTYGKLYQGCPDCTNDSMKNDVNDLIKRSKEAHNNKYDYSLVEYINLKVKVKIICPEHGEFEQNFKNHLHNKRGCPRCANKNKTTDIFIKEAKNIHKKYYDYKLVEYKNAISKINIICMKCNRTFTQTPNKHLQGGWLSIL